MAFNSLLDNQMVTYAEAATGNFTLKAGQTNPGGIQCMTKDMANAIYNLLATTGSNGILGNQLMQKSFWNAAAYSHFLTMIVGNSGGAGGGWGYISGTMGSLTNPTTPIPLLGNGTIAELYYHVNGNFVGFTIQGVSSTTPPNNWTSIRIDGVGWNRTQFTMSYGNPYWYFNLNSANTNLFGTTVGATRTIEIIGTGTPPTDTTAPSAPTNVSISSITSTSMIIGWGASTDNIGIAGYKVYMNGSTTPLATVVTTQSTGTLSYNATGLTPSTSYYFTVKAYDSASSPNYSAGADSAMIQTDAAADTTAPSAPTISTSNVTSNSVKLDWIASSDNVGVTEYWVYQDGVLAYLLGNVLTLNVTGLASNTSYVFRVAARDAAGNQSPNSGPGAITTSAAAVGDTTPPTTPGTLSATAYPCYVELRWGASTDNSGSVSYDIYRGGLYWDSTVELFYEDNTDDVVTRAYTVKAVDGSGNRSAASNSVSKRALSCI